MADSRKQGDGETVMVSMWDFSCRSSQGWRDVKGSGDGLGDNRHPGDDLVVMAIRDRF